MRNVGPYTRVGRVEDRENGAWASTIFKHSGSIQVRSKAALIINEGSMILRGLAELYFYRPKMPNRFLFFAATLVQHYIIFPNVCHVTLDPRSSLVFIYSYK